MSQPNLCYATNINNMSEKQFLNWQLGYSDTKDKKPSNYISAIVPGAVQLDIARSENYPDYNYADNFKLFRWMEDMYYTYRTEFSMPKLNQGELLWFVSKGIDYQFEIYLNNQLLHVQEGMFTYVELDLTTYLLEKNILEINIMPVPKRKGFPDDRTQASNTTKPAVSYGWDWHPRLVPLGIWDDTYLEIRTASYLKDVYIDYTISNDFSFVDMTLHAKALLHSDCNYEWILSDDSGSEVLSLRGKMEKLLKEKERLTYPKLWWTHDHGDPYLYTSSFRLMNNTGNVVDEKRQKIGFRHVRLVMNDGAWNEPKEFPKSRSVSPIQLELNGRNIFAKGTNWINPEIFSGMVTHKRYKELLDIVVDTNFNIVRTWGGSVVNKESFFDLCDELGILVWQEFPLSCNQYPDEAHYLSVLKQEATAIIKRLRKHACIALWCGGNELFNAWSGMTDQSLALRLLNYLCLQYDSRTPFIPTSPLFGMGHGNYLFKWNGKDVFEFMNNSHNTAYCEFGIPGASPLSVLEKIIPENELFPPQYNTAWEAHHALNAWDIDPETWLCEKILTEYFGEAQSLNELIEQSQLLQNEGYKAIYEESRRKKPYCSMALNWCFNEPWPAAANNSLLAYPTVPKPALYAVRNSCRPVCASARFSKFVWHEDEYFFSDIFLLNDSYTVLDEQDVTIKIMGDEDIVILTWHSPKGEANTNIEGPTARFRLPKWKTDRFKVLVEVEGKPEYNAEYTLLYRNKKETKNKTATMNV